MAAGARRGESRCADPRSDRCVGRAQRHDREPRRDVECDAAHRVDTQKNTLVARERDHAAVQARRAAFIEAQAQLDAQRLIFVDESGFRLGSPPRFGWAPRGEDSPGKTVEGCWETITMIGAVALDGFRGLMTINAGTSNEVFLAFVEQVLKPHLRSGDLVVMDHLAAHKNRRAAEAIRSAGADVLFLPPYSPDLNPIEKAWAKLKDFLRRLSTLTRDEFDRGIVSAMDAVTSDDIRGWTAHAGYVL
jgi:transposase